MDVKQQSTNRQLVVGGWDGGGVESTRTAVETVWGLVYKMDEVGTGWIGGGGGGGTHCGDSLGGWFKSWTKVRRREHSSGAV